MFKKAEQGGVAAAETGADIVYKDDGC